eukprot:gene11527-11669_t
MEESERANGSIDAKAQLQEVYHPLRQYRTLCVPPGLQLLLFAGHVLGPDSALALEGLALDTYSLAQEDTPALQLTFYQAPDGCLHAVYSPGQDVAPATHAVCSENAMSVLHSNSGASVSHRPLLEH